MSAVQIDGLGLDDLLTREWIATNRLGGYSCSTVPAFNTRKYHGMLVAAMSPPVRRMVLLSRVEETVLANDDTRESLACSEYPGTVFPNGHTRLRAFAAVPFPRWAYQGDGWTLVKELRLFPESNTVCLRYTLLAAKEDVTLELRPLFAMRAMHELTFQWNGAPQAKAHGETPNHFRLPPTRRSPEVFFAHDGEILEPEAHWYLNTIYRRERERGYAGLEDLWMPGVVRATLQPGASLNFVCSSEPVELRRAIARFDELDRETPASRTLIATSQPDSTLESLTRAADQFVLKQGAMMTAYPWSPPSVRDGLIALPGALLTTGRFDAALAYLSNIAAKLEGGLIPTELPEDGSSPTHGGADTSLWFVNAVHQYVRYSGDAKSLRSAGLFDACAKIVEHYRTGVPSIGLTCDASGLIGSRVPGAGTSWMDAKVGDWVITPRQGKTVELNALWYNALRIVAPWCEQFDQPRRASDLGALAERVKIAFNRAFWHESAGCCHDVISDNVSDASIRPNQLLAISLPFPVLDAARFESVLNVVREKLLAPFGLRTLSRDDPAYQPHYGGDVVSRDRAYHQGTSYPWLLGPYVTALIRTRGRTESARSEALDALSGCLQHLENDGLGQLCELFDGSEPYTPGGAIASARSVGEVLRCYVEDVLGRNPEAPPTTNKAPTVRLPTVKS